MHLYSLLACRVAAGAVRDVSVHHLGKRVLSTNHFRIVAVVAGVGLVIAGIRRVGSAGNDPTYAIIVQGKGVLNAPSMAVSRSRWCGSGHSPDRIARDARHPWHDN